MKTGKNIHPLFNEILAMVRPPEPKKQKKKIIKTLKNGNT
jgi:hypothetical protein